MPPAHVMVRKGPLLRRSRVRNGTGDSRHPQGTAARASSASCLCPRAGGLSRLSRPPQHHLPPSEQCPWHPSMVLQRARGAQLGETLPGTRSGALSCLLLLLTQMLCVL